MEKTHGILHRVTEGLYGYHGWPSVCRDGRGRLYAVYSGGRVRHICPFGKTVMQISDDGGRSWCPPMVINESPLDDRDAGILCLDGGDETHPAHLLVSWFVHPAEVYRTAYVREVCGGGTPGEDAVCRAQLDSWSELSEAQQQGGSYVMRSDDGGVTWSERIRVPVSSPHGPGLLADGTILYLGKSMYSDREKPGVIACWASADGGRSWERRGEVAFPAGYGAHNFHEPHVIELPDGRLLGAIRSQEAPSWHDFTIFTCFSEDGGRSWTTPQSLDVSGSPPHLLLHSSGRVICTFGRREKPFGEYALISADGGRSWEREVVIDDRPQEGDLGYPATVELDDGRLLTVYYQRYEDDRKPSVLYTVWSL